jgi:hypothetical protein
MRISRLVAPHVAFLIGLLAPIGYGQPGQVVRVQGSLRCRPTRV